jgi:hypothetical protein
MQTGKQQDLYEKEKKKNALTVSISSLCIAGFCENFARFPVKTISSQRDAHTYAPQLQERGGV